MKKNKMLKFLVGASVATSTILGGQAYAQFGIGSRCVCYRTQDNNARMQGYYYVCCNADGLCQYSQMPMLGCRTQ